MRASRSSTTFVGAFAILGGVGLVVLGAACGSLKDAPSDGPGANSSGANSSGTSGGGGSSGSSGTSGGSSGASGSSSGASGSSGGEDGGPVGDGAAGDGAGPTGLDPGVPIPPLGNETCNPPGGYQLCTGTAACRMATPTSGRCDDDCYLLGTCHLIGQPCTLASDCDINLNCFRGSCTMVCDFKYPQTCGGTRKCLDVGYTGGFGLCDPTY